MNTDNAPIVACHAAEDYSLCITFADGLRGSVNVQNLLDIGRFKHWRDLRIFLTARPDRETGDLVWPSAGIRLSCEVLHQAIEADGGKYGQPPARASSGVEPGFFRFMARALEPIKRAPRRPGGTRKGGTA